MNPRLPQEEVLAILTARAVDPMALESGAYVILRVAKANSRENVFQFPERQKNEPKDPHKETESCRQTLDKEIRYAHAASAV